MKGKDKAGGIAIAVGLVAALCAVVVLGERAADRDAPQCFYEYPDGQRCGNRSARGWTSRGSFCAKHPGGENRWWEAGEPTEAERAYPGGRAPVTGPRPGPIATGEERLGEALLDFAADPCGDRALELTRLAFIGWHLTCPGCAAVPASSVLPEAAIRAGERWAVSGSILASEALRKADECF